MSEFELAGSDDDALLQALRNLWPILAPAGRQTALDTANTIRARENNP